MPAQSRGIATGRQRASISVMKKLLFIVVLLLFLAGGGGAAWWFLLRGEEPQTAETEQAAAKPAFVELPKMAVPVIQDDGSVKTFVIELTLELASEDAVAPVTEMLPRISDRILVTLHELLGRRFIVDSGYDQRLIKAHLERVARQEAGGDHIAAVLIKNIEEFRRG